MSDTPRTDAMVGTVQMGDIGNGIGFAEATKLCREMERELADERFRSAADAKALERQRDEAIAALRELLRVAEMDEPRFNEYHDACQTAERLLNQKEGT